ncbi:zinc metalloproteinase nas-15-like isoform X3 [Biomphalaria glabrata]|uniref:Metalloendopeptidase n=1 Tax=Biomphalaria glabrata TaxID=6526 RepID=A0A9W3AV15_BIOGL|nr:zinc metalloproteinase nas-15-like isoform X3 [Biomphalaria glabrata]
MGSYSFWTSFVVLLSLTQDAGAKAPRPDFKNIYEPKTNKTIDQVISEMLGGMDIASNMILADDGKILAELDMYLSRDQFLHMYQPPRAEEMFKMGMMPAPDGVSLDENYFANLAKDQTSRKKRKAAKSTTLRWTEGIIPYSFASGHFDEKEQYMMRRALTEWERYTCVQFRPATNQDRNSVRFQNGVGCNSLLGMVGGVQDLNLQAPGCRYKGLYLHEVGHAIGLVHEHQLPDRDNYISILYQNVQPQMRVWFNKYTLDVVDQMKVPYELSSVMHYGITAFSVDGQKQTIRANDQSRQDEIGEVYLKELSYTDVEIVNFMYNCSRRCPDPNKCGPTGHLDQNCECICEDGSSDCDKTKTTKNAQCVNDYNSWACYIWANQGECERNPKYMKAYCKKACGECGTGPRSQGKKSRLWSWTWFPLMTKMLPKQLRNIGPCKDFYSPQKCKTWKERGDCSTNTRWMINNCQATCGLCGDVATRPQFNCSNIHIDTQKCEEWAKMGECVVNAQWMFDNCKKSCGMCLDKEVTGGGTDNSVDEDKLECVDTHENCKSWADNGECQANPSWMINNCRKSCEKCEDGSCKNLYDDVQCEIWSQKLECLSNPEWMMKHCTKACGTGKCAGVTTSATVTTRRPGSGFTKSTARPVVTTTSSTCNNLHNSDTECQIWAKNDHCHINPRWMNKNCYKACSGCDGSTILTTTPTLVTGTVITGDQCEDMNEGCPGWARDGYCDSNPRYNLIYCKKSCNNCNGCRDTEVLCSVWAKDGHCERNARFMMRHCQKSCQACLMYEALDQLKPVDSVTTPKANGNAAVALVSSLWSLILMPVSVTYFKYLL